MRILLVEDDIDLAQFIRKGLKEERYALDVAADGDAGLDLAMHNPYALFILDIMWSKLDGLALCRRLRANRKVARCPASLAGRKIVLANKEYALLEFLLRNKTGCRRARRLLTMCGTSVMTRSPLLWMHTSGRFEPRSTVASLLSSS
jgi:DNA-binding response OmpR family regulator